jgi:DNA-binding transcriptional MerR regulator
MNWTLTLREALASSMSGHDPCVDHAIRVDHAIGVDHGGRTRRAASRRRVESDGRDRPMGDGSGGTPSAPTAGALTVGEVAGLAGVTVRTLHHYDAIGLVSPSDRTASGYRLYGERDLDRLHAVLAYRELGFALEDVASLLDGAADPLEHLRHQHELVQERIDRLSRLLGSLEKTMEAYMSGMRLTPEERFEVFGEHDPEQYADEARERWGETDAYRTSQRRAATYTKDDWVRIRDEAEAILGRFAAAHAAGLPPDGPDAMDAAREHRAHITRWFYECTPEIHRGLAQMYIDDERFTRHYEDRAPGLARYVHDAIIADTARPA